MSFKSTKDLYIVQDLVRRLATPFEDMRAYHLGIIDQRGYVLRPRRTLRNEEKDAWTWLDVLVTNVKRIMESTAIGKTRTATYVGAMYLLREVPAPEKRRLREAFEQDNMRVLRNMLRESLTGFVGTPLLTEARLVEKTTTKPVKSMKCSKCHSPMVAVYRDGDYDETVCPVCDKSALTEDCGDPDKHVDEDAPANAAATGGVAGLGVGPQGEPGVNLKKKRNEEIGDCPECGAEPGCNIDCSTCMSLNENHELFGGHRVFEVDSDRFHKARLGKRRYHKYSKYVGEDELGNTIREYGKSNPKAPIILRNSQTGAHLYLRYGRQLHGFDVHHGDYRPRRILKGSVGMAQE